MRMELRLSGRVDVYHHDDDDIERLTIRVHPPTGRTNIHGGSKVATVVEITDEQQIQVSYSAQDAAGNKTDLSGATWAAVVADPSICSAAADGAGNVNVVSENAPSGGTSVGQTTVAVSATLADGTVLTDEIAVNVTPSVASSLTGAAGAPSAR